MTEPNPFTAFDYLEYAIQFHNAFHELKQQQPPLYWPRYFLLCHAIELALKAFLAKLGATPDQLKYDFGHKLDELVIDAVEKGLPLTTKPKTGSRLLKERTLNSGIAIQARVPSTSSSNLSLPLMNCSTR
jgi:hypothetical protein